MNCTCPFTLVDSVCFVIFHILSKMVPSRYQDYICHPSLLFLRYCEVFAIFPQRFMRHQRRCPGREASTKTNPQFGFSQTRMRDRNSPENKSIASRAMRESAAEAVVGEPQTCSNPSHANCGGRSGAAATRLMSPTSWAEGASLCRIASITRQMASRRESAALNSFG